MNFAQTILKPLRRLGKRILYSPRGVRMGNHSYIQLPRWIESPDCLQVGANTVILPGARISAIRRYCNFVYEPKIRIGDGVYIGRHAYFVAIDSIEIDDGCVLSEYVYITDLAHGLHPDKGPIMEQPLESKGPVQIGKSCFLGFRVSVMPGVSLGEHCIVGANSVVTKSFPAGSMIAGCPAVLIKKFDRASGQWISVAT